MNHDTGKCIPCHAKRCLRCQQHISKATFKVIQLVKLLIFTIKSTAQAASPLTY